MRSPRKLPVLVLAALGAALIALLVAGCGGSSSSGGGGDPATLAPASAPVYLEANLAPDSGESEALNELTQKILGIDNLGEFVAEELEKSALGEGQKFSFEDEVEPWLGEKAGMYLAGYDGDDFHGYGVAVETTDSGEAEEFIEKRVEADGEKDETGEFEGDKYYVSSDDGSVLGLIGDYLAVGETKADFEAMVKTSEGEGLNEAAQFKEAEETLPAAGIGSVYVDIGGLIEEAKGQIPPETQAGFELLQIEPRNATAVASVVPHSEQVEIDFSTNLGKATAPTGDATALLESLPATATVGFASPEFGKSFGESIDELNENGIAGQVPPGQFNAAMESIGINPDQIAESLGDVAGFVEGSSQASLGGALLIEANDPTEAKNTVSNIGLLLKGTGTEGVGLLKSKEATGFTVHSAELGAQPLIVGAAGEKIVIAYGSKAAAQALRSNAKTLGTTADFEAAKDALGSTPVTAYVDGGSALKLVEALLSPTERAEFSQAKPYLQKISYAAIGSESKGAATAAKMIVGLGK
jgi:Protein of unknown function (DUF3352)